MLLEFYSVRKLHHKALELLEDLERSVSCALLEKNKTDGKVDDPHSSGNLQSSHEYMVLIAQFLRVLGKKHAELFFEFSQRVLSVNLCWDFQSLHSVKSPQQIQILIQLRSYLNQQRLTLIRILNKGATDSRVSKRSLLISCLWLQCVVYILQIYRLLI